MKRLRFRGASSFSQKQRECKEGTLDSACFRNFTMATSYYSQVWRWQVLIRQKRAGDGRHGSSPGSAAYEPWGLVEPSITWSGTGCSLASPPVLTGEVTCWVFFFLPLTPFSWRKLAQKENRIRRKRDELQVSPTPNNHSWSWRAGLVQRQHRRGT